jgi:hypothetical protein
MEYQWVSILALTGWLVLAGSALAAYRLSWKKGIVMALSWAAIFAAVAALFSAVRG